MLGSSPLYIVPIFVDEQRAIHMYYNILGIMKQFNCVIRQNGRAEAASARAGNKQLLRRIIDISFIYFTFLHSTRFAVLCGFFDHQHEE